MKHLYAIRPMALIVKLVRFFFMFLLTTLSQTNFLFGFFLKEKDVTGCNV